MRHIIAAGVLMSACVYGTTARAFAPDPTGPQPSSLRPASGVALAPSRASKFVGTTDDRQIDEDGTVTFLGQVYLGIPQSANPSSEAVANIIETYFKSVVGDANIELKLLTSDSDEAGGSRYAYIQTVRGVPVLGTYALAHVQDSAVNFSRQFLVQTPRMSTVPNVDPATAESTAREDVLSFAAVANAGTEPTLLHVLYVESAPRLVWEVSVKAEDPYGAYHVYVDAQDGSVVTRVKTSMDSVSGEVTGTIEPTCQGDDPVSVSLPHLQLSDTLTTNADGTFETKHELAQVKMNLSGPYFKIISHARDTVSWSSPLEALPVFNEVTLDQAPLAQIDAYYYVHQARGWLVDRLDATSTFSRNRAVNWANNQLPVHVNLPNGHHGMSCNAFYDGTSLNFYVAEPRYGCNNSSRAAKIVFHEYGHGIHDHLTAARNTFDSQVSEGVADYIAASITNDPNITGLVGCSKPLRGRTTVRTCENNYSYCHSKKCNSFPRDEVHNAAPVICGALWDLRGELKQRYGAAEGVSKADKFFLRFLTLVTDMSSSYSAAIAADEDDDNDPSNGTKHSCEINRAFFAEGMAKRGHFPEAAKQRVPCVAVADQPQN